MIASDATETALRTLLDVHETTELERLRAENARLREELRLWKGDTILPTVGAYYWAEDHVVEGELALFENLVMLLRYDGDFWQTITREDGSSFRFCEHTFTAPYRYADDDGFGREGWVKVVLRTVDLHWVYPVKWDGDHGDRTVPLCYLSSDDTVELWGSFEG